MESRQAFGTLLEDEVLAPVAVMSGDDEDEYADSNFGPDSRRSHSLESDLATGPDRAA